MDDDVLYLKRGTVYTKIKILTSPVYSLSCSKTVNVFVWLNANKYIWKNVGN